MRDRFHRLLHGQVCRVCKKKRRITWFLDSGCCTYLCVVEGLSRLDTTTNP